MLIFWLWLIPVTLALFVFMDKITRLQLRDYRTEQDLDGYLMPRSFIPLFLNKSLLSTHRSKTLISSNYYRKLNHSVKWTLLLTVMMIGSVNQKMHFILETKEVGCMLPWYYQMIIKSWANLAQILTEHIFLLTVLWLIL